MQAVIYTRISRDREGAGLGVDRQRSDCLALAESLGWTVVEEFSDNDISAYSGRRRPEYEAMLAMLESGGANAILVWHSDRLHRSPVELESFIDLCDRYSIAVRTVQAGHFDLSTASGKMVARMLGAAARHEVEHSIERQKRAKLQAALEGKYRGGRRAFGFEPDGLSLRTVEAEAIRQGTSRILSGVSLAQVVREWNAAGLVTTRNQRQWTSRDVKKVLLRPRNAALSLHEGKIVGGAQWPAIVDPDDFHALVALLSDPKRRTSFAYERSHMGVGVYVCGVCGAKMQIATMIRGKTARAKMYRCAASPHIGRIADQLDEYVSEIVIARLSLPDAAITLGSEVVDATALQVQRDGLQGRLDELASMFAQDAIDGGQLLRGSTELRARIDAIDVELRQARSSSVLSDLVLAGDRLRDVWESLSVDLQGKVVDALMTVTVLPAGRGRQPGGGYFSPQFIEIERKA
ncbi:recombinase family protein [Rhodococcus qingshengii]